MKKNSPNKVFPNDYICPDKDNCPYRSEHSTTTIEDKLKNPDLFCPHEIPHPRSSWCNGNKCCKNCEPIPKEEWGTKVPFRF